MDREAMLTGEDAAWRELLDALAAMPPDRRSVEGVVPGWSTHDLVWHCAYWANVTGDMLERIRGGDPDPDDRADPEAEILAQGRGLSWDEVVARAEQGRQRARTALSAFDDIPERATTWFVEDTTEHFEEHQAQIRAFNS
jgi:uncharacterized protein (TIGR03083 family)